MSELLAFERTLEEWRQGQFNGGCLCCVHRRAQAGVRVLVEWTLLDRRDKDLWIDQHLGDAAVEALEECVALARERRLEFAT